MEGRIKEETNYIKNTSETSSPFAHVCMMAIPYIQSEKPDIYPRLSAECVSRSDERLD